MFKKLGSVKLTIVLLILLVLASIVGTLIPQTRTEQQYRARYGDARYRFLTMLQLTDVYHSIWYRFLLLALCINLVVCSTQNLGPLMRSLTRSSSTARRVKLRDLPFYREVRLGKNTKSAGSEEAAQQVKNTLTRSLYRLKSVDTESGVSYFERGKLGRLGPLITHASVVIILIGGIFVATFGFKGYKNIPVGETVDIPHSDFQIRADDFSVEFYEGSQTPKEYTSVLTVIDDGESKLTKTIEVNYPLKYKGVKFYQSSYGLMDGAGLGNVIEVEISRKKVSDKPEGEVIGKFKVDVREVFEVPDSQLKIKVSSLVPDFVRDGSGHVHSRSSSPNNPAALLELYEGDELKYKAWSFLKHPDFHGSSESDYLLKFVSVDMTEEKYYTGLQIAYHPGLPIVWVGFLLMMVGMFLAFYLPFKRIWVRLSDDSVEIGGRSHRNRAGFEKEFNRLKAIFD